MTTAEVIILWWAWLSRPVLVVPFQEIFCLSHPFQCGILDQRYPLQGQSSQGQTAESMKLTSPLSKANSTSLLHLSRQQEVSPDTGSPHSQGNSSLTVFQNSSLESCSSLDDQSPFHSMLSLTSSSSACNPETDGLEHAPVKKRKVHPLYLCPPTIWPSHCKMWPEIHHLDSGVIVS